MENGAFTEALYVVRNGMHEHCDWRDSIGRAVDQCACIQFILQHLPGFTKEMTISRSGLLLQIFSNNILVCGI